MNAVTFPGRNHDRDEPRFESARIPPHSIEAEQAVLGGLMISPRAWWEVADVLREDQFYRRDHQLIFRAIAEMAERKQPCDAVTIGEWFEANGHAEQVGGSSYVLELSSTTPSAANVRAYAKIVAEKALLRSMIDVGIKLTDDAFSPGGVSSVEIIGRAQTEIASLLDAEPCELENVGPVMKRVMAQIQERYQSDAEIHGLTTGLSELDHMLGGLVPGLYLLAARPKMGKTALALNIAEHVAVKLGKPAAMFSFEMTPEQLGERMLASIGDINAHRIRTGKLDDVDWPNVTRAMREIVPAKLYLSRPKRARIEHVTAQLRRQHARTPFALVVIDYLQLIEVDGDNYAQGIGRITRALKLTSMELGVPILLLSQLNRKVEDRPNKRPLPSDTRDSGAIEQDCDAMLFVYRDEVYHDDSRDRGTAEIIVALQRNGPTGTVRALYQADRFRFSDLPADWVPLPAPEPDATSTRKPRGLRRSREVPVHDRRTGTDG